MEKLNQNLDRVFHEPSRLAIMTELCASPNSALTFVELKACCDLTDGNLNRHLAALEKARAVKIKKAFVEAKPRTTIYLTESGRESFLEYLQALEALLKDTVKRTKPEKEKVPRSSALMKLKPA